MWSVLSLFIILRFICARVNRVALELNRDCNDAYDSAAHSSRFGIPADAIADLESLVGHRDSLRTHPSSHGATSQQKMKVEQPAGIAETVEHGVDLNVRVSRKKPGFVFFEDADDLRFGKSKTSSRVVSFEAVGLRISTYFRGPYRATRQVRRRYLARRRVHSRVNP